MRIATLVTIVVLGAAACVRTNATLLDLAADPRPPVSPAQVRIYRSVEQVPRKYVEIALLTATGESSATDERKMLEALRARAGKVGANGVILDAISEPSAGAKVAAAVFSTSAERKGRAIAIYVLPDSAAP